MMVARFLNKENKDKDWAKERLPRYLKLLDSHPEFVNAQYETLSYKSKDEWFVGRYPLFTLVCEERDKAINGNNSLLFDSKYGCRQEYIDWLILDSGLYK